MGKKLLVSLAMEGKFWSGGWGIEDDDDVLTAMARELVTQRGVGSRRGRFGKDAEKYGNQPDYDITNQARGVIMSITGEPDLDPEVPPEYKRPLKQGNWMGWYIGGAWASFGIMTAMYYKRKTGKGQMVDCSPPEGLLAISNYAMQYYHMSRNLMPRARETMTTRFSLTLT